MKSFVIEDRHGRRVGERVSAMSGWEALHARFPEAESVAMGVDNITHYAMTEDQYGRLRTVAACRTGEQPFRLIGGGPEFVLVIRYLAGGTVPSVHGITRDRKLHTYARECDVVFLDG